MFKDEIKNMQKFEIISIIPIIFLFLIRSALALEPFCGWSTFSFCLKDLDCQAGGCSGQVCEKKGEGTITTCEFKECYDAEKYNLTCQCINNQCQWGYQDKTPFSKPEPASKLKIFFQAFTFINPLFFLVFGIILIFLAKLAKFVGIILLILGLIGLLLWLF